MLQDIKDLYGNKVSALDGTIGQVKDFYFDRSTWAIRYLVVDTGAWLAGRLVLLAPHAFGRLDRYERTLHVKLSSQQIENSPKLEAQQPVSREHEIACHHHYGWPAYWNADTRWGLTDFPGLRGRSTAKTEVQPPPRAYPPLESTQSLGGYQIQTEKGTIGTLSGFTVFDRTWIICDLIVKPGEWYAGKDLRVTPDQIRQISHENSSVLINLTKSDMEWTVGKQLTQAWAGRTGA